MDLIRTVFALISAALDGRRVETGDVQSEADWGQILGICAAQHIHTFVYDSLPESLIPENVLNLWRAKTIENEQVNRVIDAVVKAQEAAWKERGLGYALLKGPSVAALYPEPLHRGCGDIDWWLGDDRSWNEALRLAERNSKNGISRDSDGDCNYIFKGIVVEYHRDWSHLSSRRLRRIAGPPEIIDGRLGAEDTLLSLICHILHHAAWKGVNLKQFIDLAVALRHYSGAYDSRHFAARLERLGLDGWASLLSSILQEMTGIREVCIPVRSGYRESDRLRLLSVLFESKPSLTSRLMLMWHASRRECLARYWHLMTGRLTK